MFQETIKLFDQYCHSFETAPTELHQHLAAEVKERLKQLDLIIVRAHGLEQSDNEVHRRIQSAMSSHGVNIFAAGMASEDKASSEPASVIEGEFQQAIEISIELRLFTEAFYYFAARIRTILLHRTHPLPYLQSFECKGVRDVRNHLIEHPEGVSSQVFVQSFSYGNAQGPILKDSRPPDQGSAFADHGLYRNAEEFKVNLEQVLKNAIARA